MEECKIFKINELQKHKFVVVLSRYNGKILLSRHKERTTWETQGGHIEPGETPLEAAKRELYEESGALEYKIEPLFAQAGY
ncbi:MAG: NUDIX domain-containing protein [Lachnospiraceae bacterium]|nr:NUDIX domain-containing protein [Lachnospiraceae bacterium]MCM1238546.1 NUDIX domain-containing protein [Lachnospiraceae bacterium]